MSTINNNVKYKPPFPWFGGKSRVANVVWKHLGDVAHYVEPFFGSGAVLFMRPTTPKFEVINDKDHFVANFWRAVKYDPEGVAHYANNPINEDDLLARHIWLVKYGMPELAERIPADPDYYNTKIAGWWVWGISIWIGGGWCSGKGQWTEIGGKLVYIEHSKNSKQDIDKELQFLDEDNEVNKKYLQLKNLQGVSRRRPHLGRLEGIKRKSTKLMGLTSYMQSLANRLENVSVCCGDWERVVTTGALAHGSTIGVFLDPPYSKDMRSIGVYNVDDNITTKVREWCIANYKNPRYRIALCGYEGEHNELEKLGWRKYEWKAHRSYGRSHGKTNNSENIFKERIWFSPNCLFDNEEDL